jgi:hypothetical protein
MYIYIYIYLISISTCTEIILWSPSTYLIDFDLSSKCFDLWPRIVVSLWGMVQALHQPLLHSPHWAHLNRASTQLQKPRLIDNWLISWSTSGWSSSPFFERATKYWCFDAKHVYVSSALVPFLDIYPHHTKVWKRIRSPDRSQTQVSFIGKWIHDRDIDGINVSIQPPVNYPLFYPLKLTEVIQKSWKKKWLGYTPPHFQAFPALGPCLLVSLSLRTSPDLAQPCLSSSLFASCDAGGFIGVPLLHPLLPQGSHTWKIIHTHIHVHVHIYSFTCIWI